MKEREKEDAELLAAEQERLKYATEEIGDQRKPAEEVASIGAAAEMKTRLKTQAELMSETEQKRRKQG